MISPAALKGLSHADSILSMAALKTRKKCYPARFMPFSGKIGQKIKKVFLFLVEFLTEKKALGKLRKNENLSCCLKAVSISVIREKHENI